MQLESGNNVNNFQLSIWLILREPGEAPLFSGGAYTASVNALR